MTAEEVSDITSCLCQKILEQGIFLSPTIGHNYGKVIVQKLFVHCTAIIVIRIIFFFSFHARVCVCS